VEVRTGVATPGDAEIVVRAGARVPSTVLADLVDGQRVQVIGTRLRGGRMYEATQSGFWSAAEI
jgi:2,4-dienoyl-CoA reductase (NADPH2)